MNKTDFVHIGYSFLEETMRRVITMPAGFSFMIFNLLCAPCFAAMGAIKREMNSAKWTFGAIGYMCAFAYAVSLIVYQLGMFFTPSSFPLGTAAACVVLCSLLYLVFRKNKNRT